MEKFRKAQQRADLVGIVSARSKDNIITFTVEENITPDFVRSSKFKGRALRKLARKYNPDTKIYIGSWFRDKMHAKAAAWKYKEL